MAQPTTYTLSYDFTAFQSASPTTPLPADKIETEFNNVELTTDEIITNLGLIQKDDGTLANGIVAVENLATELTIGLEAPTAWANGTAYVVNNTVIESNILYRCLVAHTSGVFSTDLGSGYWVEIADYSVFLTDAETAKDAAETAQTAAEAAQAAAETAYDNFDDRYLGSKSSDPTLDNDGDALATGALYWNTTLSEMRVYSGSAWGAATGATSLPIFVYTATGGETSLSGSDDNANTLAYSVGKIQVFKNGTGITQDVTATDGTSITGISPALSASDVVEIYAFDSVVVLESISTHTVAVPVKEDFVLFSDINDSNIDRKVTIENLLLVDNVIPQATSAVVTAADQILFADDSDSGATKQDTVQGLLDLFPGFASSDITGQTEVVVTASDILVFADASDSNNLKKDTIQGVIDLAQDIDSLTQVTPASTDTIMVNDVSDANNPKKVLVSSLRGEWEQIGSTLDISGADEGAFTGLDLSPYNRVKLIVEGHEDSSVDGAVMQLEFGQGSYSSNVTLASMSGSGTNGLVFYFEAIFMLPHDATYEPFVHVHGSYRENDTEGNSDGTILIGTQGDTAEIDQIRFLLSSVTESFEAGRMILLGSTL